MTSEQELDKRATDFMTFPPKKFQNERKNKNQHNVEGLRESRREISERYSCDW